MNEIEKEIVALDRKRMDAMVEGDMEVLKSVLADELTYTHSSAAQDTKQSIMGAIESGSTSYDSIVTSDVTARAYGEAVVVTGSAQMKVTPRGRQISFGVRFIDMYANKSGTWQMVAWQSTRLPD